MATLYDDETQTRFRFDPQTWVVVDEHYAPSTDHWTVQGEWSTYRSPQPRADGKHRYVRAGKGYRTDRLDCWSMHEFAEYIGTFVACDAPIEEAQS